MFSDRMAMVRRNIEDALIKSGRQGQNIDVLAVSKYYPVDAIKDAYGQGQRLFGESRVQELMEKLDELKDYDGLRIHFIGHLQTNKVKYLGDKVELIHSVDSLKLAEEINLHAAKIDHVQDILLQVNIAHDTNKTGVDENEVFALCESMSALKNVNLRGLMMIPPLTDSEESNRKYFAGMKTLFDKCVGKGYKFDTLSMGMSDDYTIAVEEGSTMVRIGTALFGGR